MVAYIKAQTILLIVIFERAIYNSHILSMQTAYISIFQKSKTHCNEGIIPNKISNTSVYPLKHFHILYVANISVYFWSLSLSHLSLDFNAFMFYCLTFHLQKCCEFKDKLLPM